ncbi:hypothetical protein OOZ15_03030 [Galbibacter sp. EGI 63066]|uniref:hypothetical protein n=1 Tax=Galbibacter sp. EGI 63066 TaxID=2993559 RepID=UPI0022488C2B|nr:hypothetical protein [Galbibacter sp. EGI 63066]MCX2678903.1 hypothetical protein [Galbibacter sp. EGI 63066]
MKNLENYGVLELDAIEASQVDGGGKLAEWLGYVIGAMVGNGPTYAEQTNRAFT